MKKSKPLEQATQEPLKLWDEALLKLALSDLKQAQLIEEMRAEGKGATERHEILLDQLIKSQLRIEHQTETPERAFCPIDKTGAQPRRAHQRA